MNTSWEQTIAGAAAIVLLGASAGMARAATIDFEDTGVSGGTIEFFGGDINSGGFRFDADQDHSHGENEAGIYAPNNGSTHWIWDDFAGEQLTVMTKLGGGVFSVFSVDLVQGFPAILAAAQVTFTGELSGGGTVTETFDILDTWATYAFTDARWGGIISLAFTGSGGRGSEDYFVVDNIRVGEVPEPSGLVLFGFGMLAGAVLRYRRRGAG